MGRHAVTKCFQVGLEWFKWQASGFQSGKVVLVEVKALASGDQFCATKEQVEGVRELGPYGIRVSIEWPLAHGVACYEEEVTSVFLLCPFTKPAFILR